MTAIEQEYLVKAFEVEEHVRPRGTPGRIIPPLSWRTIGVLCDLSGKESDELLNRLAAAGQLRIVDAKKRLMTLTEGRELAQTELEARRRRFWNRLEWIIVPLATILYWLIHGF